MGTLPDFESARAEIRQLGTVVNQLTLSFHRAETPHQKMFFALEVLEQYAKVGEKVDRLIPMVSELLVTPIKGNRRMTLEQLFKENEIKLS
jgi:hypothetical protein